MKKVFLNILAVCCHPVNIPLVVEKVDNLIKSGGKGYITVTGVHGIIESQRSIGNRGQSYIIQFTT